MCVCVFLSERRGREIERERERWRERENNKYFAYMRIAAFSHYFVVENAFMSRIYIPFPTINRQKNIEYFTRKKKLLNHYFYN